MAKNKVKRVMSPEDRMDLIWTIWNLVEALLLLVAGVLSIVFGIMAGNDGAISSNGEVIQNIVLYVLASFVILDGLLRTIMLAKNYKQSESSAYLVGGFEITIGIVLMIMGAAYFFQLIINFLGVFLIVIGALFLFVSIFSIVKKVEKMLMPILEIVFGAILVGFGVALLVLFYASGNESRNRVVFILIGSIMALAGLAMAIIALLRARKRRKAMKDRPNTYAPAPAQEEPVHKDVFDNKEKKEEGPIKEIDSIDPPAIENKEGN